MLFDVIPTVDIGNSFKLGNNVSIKDVPPLTTLGGFISAVLPSVFVISGIILLVLLIVGGLMMIASAGSGDAKKVEQGQKALTSAILGMVVIFCAWWIIKIIEFVTGIKIF